MASFRSIPHAATPAQRDEVEYSPRGFKSGIGQVVRSVNGPNEAWFRLVADKIELRIGSGLGEPRIAERVNTYEATCKVTLKPLSEFVGRQTRQRRGFFRQDVKMMLHRRAQLVCS